MIADR